MPNFFDSKLGEQIAAFRRRQKLSGEDLAQRAGNGLTRSVIANLENGRKQDVTLRQFVALSVALSVSPVSLLFDLLDPYSDIVVAEVDGRAIRAAEWLAFGWFGGQLSANELAPHSDQGDFDVRYAGEAAVYVYGRLLERSRLLDQERRLLADIESAEGDDDASNTRRNSAQASLTQVRAQLFSIERFLRHDGVDLRREPVGPGGPF